MSNKECLENNTESSGGNTKKNLYEKIASLMEKAQELSTLCDVQPGIVIFTPGKDILWPTESQAKERFQNYLSFRWDTRNDNLVTHETNLEKKKKAQEENIRIMEQENEEKEMELLFNEVIDGKSYLELDARELKGMIKLIALKKTKVDERKKQLQEEDQPIKGNDNNIEEKNDSIPKNNYV
ncbi:agamous-like MADS-box protein AGL92 [Solanum tuberosum]|uniref:Type I MADS box transcription factor n=2 Tax=Solanum tuberosum TaxID=4113 RepID=M1E020_SOLTU|nr:PREDICTED: agamous-like MADS-box protein AGL92 [Solanum tuberosum]